MTSDTCNCYFSFWAIFCPFTPTCLKNENFKKMKKKKQNKTKKTWRYYHFTQVYQKS